MGGLEFSGGRAANCPMKFHALTIKIGSINVHVGKIAGRTKSDEGGRDKKKKKKKKNKKGFMRHWGGKIWDFLF
jgi:hypothetical protein